MRLLAAAALHVCCSRRLPWPPNSSCSSRRAACGASASTATSRPPTSKTTEGKRAPLRRVDIARPNPADLAFIRRERFTPVFVLVDGGKEYGRIRGYPGDTFFWGLLATLIERLDRGEAAPAAPAGSAAPPGVTFAE